jgi:hypothetical protein
MAIRAKLSAPRDEQQTWRWHEAKWTSISASILKRGDRRLEGDNYLLGGYGIRLAFESQHIPLPTVSALATVWQPSRLKGIQLTKEHGTPFLAATQVYDLRPSPRKFLSLDRTSGSSERFIDNGTIVVTCSGNVGRVTLIYNAHLGVLISHDLLRITPKDNAAWGWIYAFLRSSQGAAMMTSAQYGHMIKHLEPSHIHALPIPVPRNEVLTEFQQYVTEILNSRNQAWDLQAKAEKIFSEAIGSAAINVGSASAGFSVKATELFRKRRRFEASFHSPVATEILQQFERIGLKTEPLRAVTEKVWWMTRFKRVFGEAGVRYMSADNLFSINPSNIKKVMIEQAENPDAYRVKAGWIVMACSGQTYGLNGSVALMTEPHEDAFFSHDLVRIIADKSKIRAGYLFAVLGHPQLGRPLVIRNAYGTSIPHLDPEDVAAIPVVRLSEDVENEIADLMEESVALRASADVVENLITKRATELNDRFLAGDTSEFNVAFK